MWILFAALFVLLLSFAYAAASGAPWVPTWKRDIDRLERLLDLKPGERFYELGCGDGRVTLALAQRTGARSTGIELSLIQWSAAQLRRLLGRPADVSFRLGNIFTADLSDADAVYVFLMPEAYKKLRPKFERELKPGARVVSYVWPIQGWQAACTDQCPGAPNLYLYVR